MVSEHTSLRHTGDAEITARIVALCWELCELRAKPQIPSPVLLPRTSQFPAGRVEPMIEASEYRGTDIAADALLLRYPMGIAVWAGVSAEMRSAGGGFSSSPALSR